MATRVFTKFGYFTMEFSTFSEHPAPPDKETRRQKMIEESEGGFQEDLPGQFAHAEKQRVEAFPV
jgi:hypothetical protein